MSSFLIRGNQSITELYGRQLTWANHYWRIPRDPQPPPETPNGINPPVNDTTSTSLPSSLGGYPSPEPGEAIYSTTNSSNFPSQMLGASPSELAGAISKGMNREGWGSLNEVTAPPPAEGSQNSIYATGWGGSVINTLDGPTATLWRTILIGSSHMVYQSSAWYLNLYFGSASRYHDLYDRWIWQLTIRQTLVIRSWSCPQGEPNLSPFEEEVGQRCAPPLPPIVNPGLGGSGSSRLRETKKRKPKRIIMSGCCSCAAIADMIAQQTVQIKGLLEEQNMQIGTALTDQTQFLQDQIIAAVPSGFDYEPVFNKIEDATNRIWNGLNK